MPSRLPVPPEDERRSSAPPARQRPRQAAPRSAGHSPPTQVPQPTGYQPPVPPDPVGSYVQPRPARRARPPMQTPPSESGWYLPWWSLVVLIAVVAVAAFGTLYVAGNLGQAAAPGNQTPRVQVVTAPPTLSQDFLGAPAPQVTAAPSVPQAQPSAAAPLPTPIPSPSLPPGEFAVGSQVRVVGVGLSGLNIRSSPGLSGTQRFLAYDDDEFVIVGGPQSADDLEWWQIEDPDDDNRQGWAARNYLEAIGN